MSKIEALYSKVPASFDEHGVLSVLYDIISDAGINCDTTLEEGMKQEVTGPDTKLAKITVEIIEYD